MGDRVEVAKHDRYSFEQQSDVNAVDSLREYGLGPHSEEEFYHLEEDTTYVVDYEEDITIPDGHVGLVFPEDTLLHAGAMLFTGVWEPNDQPPYEGTLSVDRDLLLEANLQVGTLVLFESDAL